jgi:hypothetical protein
VKFSTTYVKQNPVMFGVIFVVFGLLVWMMLNRGSGGGSTSVVQTGPSEALQAAQLQAGTQVQLAQIGAAQSNNAGAIQLEALSRQIEGQQSLALLETQFHTIELGANERMADNQVTASLTALQAQLNNSLATTEANNSFALGYAKNATDSAVQMTAINAMLQRSMSADQLEAFKYGTDATVKTTIAGQAFSQVGSMKKKDRDNATTYLASVFTGAPDTYIAPHDGGGFLSFVSPVAALLN